MPETPPSKPPAISVVIPAYQRPERAPAAVASVLRQSFDDIEVIVVDDASGDGTAEAVEALGDPRLRVIRHAENRGGAAARNTGIAAARAEWIAFQDSDDEWLPEKLVRQRAALARHEAGTGAAPLGVYCGMIILGAPEAERTDPSRLDYWPRARPGLPLAGDLSGALLEGSLISTQTFMGRRDAILEAGGFDEELKALQDWDLFLRLSRLGPIAFEPEPLVIQRFSANSLTKTPRNRVLALERILEKNAEAFAARPEALAERMIVLAGGHRRTGDRRAALAWARRAARAAPLRGKAWAALALAALGRGSGSGSGSGSGG